MVHWKHAIMQSGRGADGADEANRQPVADVFFVSQFDAHIYGQSRQQNQLLLASSERLGGRRKCNN